MSDKKPLDFEACYATAAFATYALNHKSAQQWYEKAKKLAKTKKEKATLVRLKRDMKRREKVKKVPSLWGIDPALR